MWNRRYALAFALSALLIPSALVAQGRAVVSKEVSVGRSEATLELEFADAGKLSVGLRNGSIVVGGRTVGSYRQGGPLDASWRALLGKLVSLDDGALADALRTWSPPADLPADAAAGAKVVEGALDTALAPPAPSKKGSEARAVGSKTGARDSTGMSELRALLDRSDRLADLGSALRSVDVERARIRVDEDVDVPAGQTVDGSLVVVDGSVRIAGTVTGDVVVVGGSLELLSGGKIHGDVRLADASMARNDGTVTGEVVDVTASHGQPPGGDIGDRIRAEVQNEVQSRVQSGVQRHGGSSLFAPFRRIVNAAGGIFQNVVMILFLGLVGAGVAAFAGTNLDAVAETARRTPGRSAAVGLAGAFLLVPVWIVGAIALTVSIIGIPVMIAWLPLFPLAAVAAGVLGYLAVAHNLGRWLAASDLRFADRIRASNPIHTVFAGLLVLIGAFVAANAVSIVPFFGFLEGLLVFVGVMASIAAVAIGFGAVLITRAGTRPEFRYADLSTEPEWDPGMAGARPATEAGNDAGTEGGDDVERP